MSKMFFDHLTDLGKIEKKIKKIAKTKEEREELFYLVDEIIHHRVIGCILDKLPKKEHKKFSKKLAKHPYDENIINYLQTKITEDVEEFIKKEIDDLRSEFLELTYKKKKTRG